MWLLIIIFALLITSLLIGRWWCGRPLQHGGAAEVPRCPPLSTLAPLNEALWQEGLLFGPGTAVDGLSARHLHFTVAQQEGVLVSYLACPEGWFLQETLLTNAGGPVERMELIGRRRWNLTFRGPVVGTVHVDLNNRQAVIARPNGDVAQGTIDRAAAVLEGDFFRGEEYREESWGTI